MSSTPVILCIDDEKVGLRVRSMVLEQCGYRVLQANSGMEGLRLLRAEGVDLAIVDFWLPDMDGGELVRRIREQSPQCKIVLLTGSVESLDTHQLDVDLALTKPILPQELQQSIKELLQHSAAA